jgi:hypothetical protein
MKVWYQWFYLSLVFAVGGLINYLNGKPIIAAIIQVCITAVLAFIQFFCDKKGEKGKKVFRCISIGVIFFLLIWLVYLIIITFS